MSKQLDWEVGGSGIEGGGERTWIFSKQQPKIFIPAELTMVWVMEILITANKN